MKGRSYTEHWWAFEELNKAIDDAKADYLNAPKTKTGASEDDTTPLAPVAGCDNPAYVRDDEGNCYLETNSVNDKGTIPEQCVEMGLPPECCKPPKYIEDPTCPHRNSKVRWIDQFNLLDTGATQIPPQTVEFDGKPVPIGRLAQGIGDSTVQIKSKLTNIKKDQPFSQSVSEDSLLQKAVMVPSGPIDNGEMVFRLNEKPKSLSIPEPDPKKYEMKSVMQLEFTSGGQKTEPLSEALFYIKQPGGTLLRYDPARRDWTPLEGQKTNDGFVARSPGNSYFAIVVEKQSSPLRGVLIVVTLVELAALIGAYVLLMRKAKKPAKKRETTGKGVAGLICGIFGILVFLFPPIGFPLAGLAIVLSRAR